MKNWQRWTVGVSALALATAAGTGIAVAAIPDSGGVIHGCYKPQSDGHSTALSVIDTALTNGHCPGGNTELTWNQTGPQGPAGATGPAGPAGPAATAQDVNSQVTYNVGSTGATPVNVTLDCPAGTLALNGGVDHVTQQLDQGATLNQAGSAGINSGLENPSGSENFSLPRPVNSGASWRMQVILGGAEEIQQNGTRQTLPITVTYYVVCE